MTFDQLDYYKSLGASQQEGKSKAERRSRNLIMIRFAKTSLEHFDGDIPHVYRSPVKRETNNGEQ